MTYCWSQRWADSPLQFTLISRSIASIAVSICGDLSPTRRACTPAVTLPGRTLFDRAVNNPGFVDQFDSVRVLIDDDKDMKRQAVSVMLCDDLGRHGSMAIGKALAECIAADPTHTLGTAHILADQHSEAYCGVCARREFWSRRWTSRSQAVKAIKEMWFTPSE